MIVKFMSGENHLEDSNPKKQCVIVNNVSGVEYRRSSKGESVLGLCFKNNEIPSILEYMVVPEGLPLAKYEWALTGNAYLMSDEGKTIQTFMF